MRNSENTLYSGWDLEKRSSPFACRLDLNDSPTAVRGIQSDPAAFVCRPGFERSTHCLIECGSREDEDVSSSDSYLPSLSDHASRFGSYRKWRIAT